MSCRCACRRWPSGADDIPVLVNHFLKRLSAAAGLPIRDIGDDAMAVLQTHGWPGNVRQLRNIVERLLILAGEEQPSAVTADLLLPTDLAAGQGGRRSSDPGDLAAAARGARDFRARLPGGADQPLRQQHLPHRRRFIGMERSALHRKLKSLGVGSAQGFNRLKVPHHHHGRPRLAPANP